MADPRLHQIAVLVGLLLWGWLGLGFGAVPEQGLVILGAALATQWLGARFVRHEAFDPRSPLISALSLILLLRTDSLLVAATAGVLAVGSKFALRWRDKHVFNPTNIALALLLLATDRAWVSSGQWGSGAALVFAVACAGPLVLRRARRSDVTWAFLTCYAGLLLGRALWLGDPLTIPLHGLQSGAFLIFAFFMISDPRTTPDSRAGRLLFAALVAGLGCVLRFGLYEPDALIFSLALSALWVPWIDRWLPDRRFTWTLERGEPHARSASPGPLAPARVLG